MVTLPPNADWFARCFAQGWSDHYTHLNQGRRPFSCMDCYGGNMAVPPGAFLEVGGFMLNLARAYDVDLGHRLEQRGFSSTPKRQSAAHIYQLGTPPSTAILRSPLVLQHDVPISPLTHKGRFAYTPAHLKQVLAITCFGRKVKADSCFPATLQITSIIYTMKMMGLRKASAKVIGIKRIAYLKYVKACTKDRNYPGGKKAVMPDIVKHYFVGTLY